VPAGGTFIILGVVIAVASGFDATIKPGVPQLTALTTTRRNLSSERTYVTALLTNLVTHGLTPPVAIRYPIATSVRRSRYLRLVASGKSTGKVRGNGILCGLSRPQRQ